MINRLLDSSTPIAVQDTTLALDVLGRFVCNTWDEAVNNGGVQFDAIVIGSGMFGAYCAEKIYRGANLRVLVLEAGAFLVSEHVQNLARIGLNPAGASAVPNNSKDPGTQALVWGIPWRSQVAFPGLAYCIREKPIGNEQHALCHREGLATSYKTGTFEVFELERWLQRIHYAFRS